MSYLDPKEQVLDLQLTPYGEFLLSIGKLNPEYYAFFDEDVIYNSGFANNSNEDQSKIQERILDETPRMSAQKSISGREQDYISKRFINISINSNKKMSLDPLNPMDSGFLPSSTTEVDVLNFIGRNPEPMQESLLMQGLGKYNPSNGYAPAWNVSVLSSNLSSSSNTLSVTGSKGVLTYNVPQLNVEIEYKIRRNSYKYNQTFASENLVGETAPDIGVVSPDNLNSIGFVLLQDGSSIGTFKDSLIIRMEESNTFYEKENFEIEFFEVEESPITGEEILIKKPFYKNKDVLLEDVINGYTAANSVENMFNVFVDREIDPAIICPLISTNKTKQFYQSNMFACESEQQPGLENGNKQQNIYYDGDLEDVC